MFRHLLGKGKLDEIRTYVCDNEIDIAIFDDDLSPSQIRNIEKALEIKILDRSNLILTYLLREPKLQMPKLRSN